MSNAFNFAKDVQGTPVNAQVLPPDVFAARLASGGLTSFTVPNSFPKYVVLFKYTDASEVWVSPNHVANAPTSQTVMQASTSLLNPDGLVVNAGDVVSVYNNGAGLSSVCAALYGML